MKARELAEKIGNKLIVARCTGEPEFLELVAWLESLLTAVLNEAKEEGKDEALGKSLAASYRRINRFDLEESYPDLMSETKAAAYEECAKIAETYFGPKSSGMESLESRIAGKIRSARLSK